MKALLPALAALTLSACSLHSPEDKEFRRLTDTSAPEEALCQKFRRDRARAIRELAAKYEPYGAREEAVAALSLVEAVPARFPRSAEASAYFLAHYEALIGSWNPFSNLANRANTSQITQDCEMFVPMQVLPKLYKEKQALKLTPADERRLEAATRAFLFRHLPNERVGILGFAVQAYVLKSYLEEQYRGKDRAPLLAEAEALNRNFEEERKLILKRPSTVLGQYAEDFTARANRRELKWRLDFGRRYEALVRKVFPGGPAPTSP
jgi:hypothetical protein